MAAVESKKPEEATAVPAVAVADGEKKDAAGGASAFKVTVPEGVKSGEMMRFVGPDGKERQTLVPEGTNEGDSITVMDAPASAPMQPFVVKVPEDWKKGEMMRFTGPDGRERTTDVPAGTEAGGSFTVMVDGPTTMQVKVKIPEGVEPGQDFQFEGPSGLRFTTKVPEDMKPGEEITIAIPSGPSGHTQITCARCGVAFQSASGTNTLCPPCRTDSTPPPTHTEVTCSKCGNKFFSASGKSTTCPPCR